MKRTRTDGERWFDVLVETDAAQAAVMTLDPAESTGGRSNAHAESEQWLYVVSGDGTAVVDDETHQVTAGDLVVIEPGETHEITAGDDAPLETLNVYVPPEY